MADLLSTVHTDASVAFVRAAQGGDRGAFEQLVSSLKDRWRTERIFEDLKGELGFDHFEGRSYRGWQHHVSVALCCYAFVAGERAVAFSPFGGETRDGTEQVAA